MTHEYAFEMATAAMRFGFGVTREVGAELAEMGKQYALVFTDPNLRSLAINARTASSSRSALRLQVILIWRR
jgi:alcohol dehydrogenase class IV